ncbi:unnamed protein product, partial [Urochloa humidicola]
MNIKLEVVSHMPGTHGPLWTESTMAEGAPTARSNGPIAIEKAQLEGLQKNVMHHAYESAMTIKILYLYSFTTHQQRWLHSLINQ